MPNTYFQFKQFRIEQERCAQKVCTDSCIFGAWAAVEQARSILDIGTGTGLLALMAAQRSAAHITAVEIVEQSAMQAKENIAQSPWHERIRVQHSSIQDYTTQSAESFDYIIVNPPFFQNSTLSATKEKRFALHDEALSFGELCQCIARLLHDAGTAGVLLPQLALDEFMPLAAECGLYARRILYVLDSPSGQAKRVCIELQKDEGNSVAIEHLVIRDERQKYTADFIAKLRDFYLWLEVEK